MKKRYTLMKPKYSILITNYNTVKTVKQSLESILNQINDNFEVIVTDNISGDGSLEILRDFEKQRKIKLIPTKCSRGKGRQIAFENSTGEILITNMDMDTFFKPKLKEVLKTYHQLEKNNKKFILSSGGAGIVISRKLIEEVGGWHDLQRGEDTELAVRLKQVGVKTINSKINLVEQHLLSWEQKEYRYLFWDKYVLLRDKMRVRMTAHELYKGSVRNGLWKSTIYGTFLFCVLLMIAKITYRFKPCY